MNGTNPLLRYWPLACALVVLFSVAALATLPAQIEDDPFEPARNEFLQAYAQPGVELKDSDELKAYPLYPYLQAARLQHALENEDAAPAAIDPQTLEFLQAHVADPVSRELSTAWLRSLARRGDWPHFLMYFHHTQTDATLRCQYLGARVNLQAADKSVDKVLKQDLIEIWLTPRQLPEECESSFAWARQRKILTAQHIEQRVRQLLENDQPVFARTVASQLPPDRSAPLLQWAQLLQQPERSIDALIANPKQSVESQALLAGWTQLARRNTDSALKRYPSLIAARLIAARGLDQETASRYALQLALGLSWNRQPNALDYFKRVAAKDLDDSALAWKARAALWAGRWDEVTRSIEAMGNTQREETRWRYWLARAAEQTGEAQKARESYEAILPKDNYYSAISAARLGQRAHPHPEALPVNEAYLKAIASQPVFIRARELLRCQFRQQALMEWARGVETLDSAAKTQAVHLAALWGWYDISVTTAARQSLFNDYELLYPRPYDQYVLTASELTSLEFALIYGVIRQESLFRPDAVSSAGALGLTQLLLGTARDTARQWNQAKPSRADLFDPGVNVPLGAAQLRGLLDRFNGQVPLALAGYNAGPNAVQRWLPDQARDTDIWIENIPYNETREYVQRVLWHSIVFAWLKSGEAQNTQGWLKPIVPPNTTL